MLNYLFDNEIKLAANKINNDIAQKFEFCEYDCTQYNLKRV